MNRLSLSARILGAFLLSFLTFMGALGYGLSQLRSFGDDLSIIEVGYLPLAKTAARLDSFQARIDLDLERLGREGARPVSRASTATSLYSERILATVTQGLAIIDAALPSSSHVEETATLTSLKGQLEIIGAAHEDFGKVALDYLDLLETGEVALAQNLEAEILSFQSELDTEISQFTNRVDESIQRVYARTTASGRRALLLTAILALVALVFGVAMLGIAVVSLRPIGHLTAEVQRIAAGNYDVRIQVNRRDELGILAEETNAMARSIQQRDEALRTRALELDAARNHLRNILDSIRLGLVVVEGELVAMANPAAADMWALSEGQPLPPFLHAEEESPSTLQRGDRIYEMKRVPFGGGEILVGEDVTQALRDRERLALSERLALVGQMLAQITHEVRNPLNALSLNAELLKEELDALPPERRSESEAILETMRSGIAHLEQATEHYLALTRRPAPVLEAEEPAEVAKGVARLLERELDQAGVTLALNGDPVGEVEMDGHQVRSAILNVVRNAVEAGAKSVHLDLTREEGQLYIQISDDGPGMTEETAKKALDPFFSTKASGTGLGLAITRQILEAHGGAVAVESLTQGTRVTLRLPA